MECAIASTASLLGISYEKALKLFNKNHRRGLKYKYSKVNRKTKKYLKVPGSIVFVECSERYPSGYYLLRMKGEWVKPWINYPKIIRQSQE